MPLFWTMPLFALGRNREKWWHGRGLMNPRRACLARYKRFCHATEYWANIAPYKLLNFFLIRVKPWPNGPPNSSQLEPSLQLRWSWVSFGHPLGLSWLELAWIWWSSNFRPTRVFHRLATSANSSQLSPSFFCYCYVTARSYLDNWMVFLRAGSTWRYRLATRRCKFWLCNLARVGLSWEYRLASL